MFASLIAVLAIFPTPLALAGDTCSVARTHAQTEFAELSAVLQLADVRGNRVSEDTRRMVLQKTYAELQASAHGANLALLQGMVSRGQRDAEYVQLFREIQSATATLAIQTMSATCGILNGSCNPEALAYPTAARAERSFIALHEHWGDEKPVLKICDQLTVQPTISPLGSVRDHLQADLAQCVMLDITTGAITQVNRVYVFTGVYDGCFGDPTSELTNFESYWQHRMRHHEECL